MIDAYFEKAGQLMEQVRESQKEAMLEAGRKIAESIGQGGIVHLFGCGHSHILSEEVFYRAGGLAAISPILHEPLMLHEGALRSSQLERKNHYAEEFLPSVSFQSGDVLIVMSTSGRNPVPVDVALWAKEKGVYVVALTSIAYSDSQPSRHESGKRLYDVGDVVIDNRVPPGDAALELDGVPVPFAPVSTLIGTAIIQSVLAQAVEEMVKNGVEPPVFLSGNIEGADEHNQRLAERYAKRVPLLTAGLKEE
ncbi:SIS domain-containing protein [Atopococcus tabaci]|uniref:SIS domain-containing protein n=1 Tax=Atopococcus tabaci TaxID=269774 RepID=UPI0004216251|nr:SIS domain-containing protein [Atopococcus tabaci]